VQTKLIIKIRGRICAHQTLIKPKDNVVKIFTQVSDKEFIIIKIRDRICAYQTLIKHRDHVHKNEISKIQEFKPVIGLKIISTITFNDFIKLRNNKIFIFTSSSSEKQKAKASTLCDDSFSSIL